MDIISQEQGNQFLDIGRHLPYRYSIRGKKAARIE